jgi:hypothetical protein
LVAVPNGLDDTASDGNPQATKSGQQTQDALDVNTTGATATQTWNDCTYNFPRYTNTNYSPSEIVEIQDDQFIELMIRDIWANYSVDHSRVYASGVSNGGNMASRLARMKSGYFAAVAVESGGTAGYTPAGQTNLDDTEFQYAGNDPDHPYRCINRTYQSSPVPMYLIKSDSDEFTVYTGGTSPFGYTYIGYEADNHDNIATVKTNDSFVSEILNRYGYVTFNGNVYGSAPNPSQTLTAGAVTCKLYQPAGTPSNTFTRSDVEDCIAHSSGDNHPGHIPPSIAVIDSVNKQNHDIETAVEEWNFFQHYTLSNPH